MKFVDFMMLSTSLHLKENNDEVEKRNISLTEPLKFAKIAGELGRFIKGDILIYKNINYLNKSYFESIRVY